MAIGANGDVPPTFPVVMDNPGDQAGLMVHELEELQEELQDQLNLAGLLVHELEELTGELIWLPIMWK